MAEVEKFMDKLEDVVKLKKKEVFYIIEEMKKEEFMSGTDYFKIDVKADNDRKLFKL